MTFPLTDREQKAWASLQSSGADHTELARQVRPVILNSLLWSLLATAAAVFCTWITWALARGLAVGLPASSPFGWEAVALYTLFLAVSLSQWYLALAGWRKVGMGIYLLGTLK